MNFLETIVWFTMNIYFEARSEPMDAMIAVGHTVCNRSKSRKLSIKDAITQPYQYSWCNPEAKKQDIISNPTLVKDIVRCLEAAYLCAKERAEGKDLEGAEWYYNPKYADPYWKNSYAYIGTYGVQRFYRK